MFKFTVFWLTFITAFSAEFACLARTIAIVSKFGSPLSVCLGTLLGNVLLLLPIFLWGDKLQQYLPEPLVRVVVGLLFIIMGIGILLHKLH